MKQKWIILACLSLFVVGLASCTTPVTTENNDAFNTIVAQSVQLTQLAGTLTVVAQQPTLEPTTQVVANPTQTSTPEPSVTPTREGTWLSFSENTNCRSGPGASNYLVKTFMTNDQVQAIGRSEDGLYAYVRFTDTSTHYCWVYQQYSSTSGDLTRLPVITPISTNTPTVTPTSAAGFSLSFNGLSECGGNYYTRVLITNTGFLTWKSMKITVEDNDTGDTISESSDEFTGYGACAVEITQSDLTTGESGIVSNFADAFAYDINNHSLTVTVTLYSKDGRDGSKSSQSISVTP